MPLQPLVVRDLPDPPRNLWKIVGPGIVAAGVGLSSGEFILWPFIASQTGLIFLWAAVLGVVTQFFLNMEIERYTLATGETALTGFNRFWKHWGLVLAIMVYFANLWPGWVLSASTLATYIFGGNARYIAICALAHHRGIADSRAGRLCRARAAHLSSKSQPSASSWRSVLPSRSTPTRGGRCRVASSAWATCRWQLGFALLLGAVAFAGAGGGQNLCQSNWIRDKGFGMGQYVPALVSPSPGHEQAAPNVSAFIFEPTPGNMARWRRWWRFANIEQFVTFVLVTVATICLTSMLAHSTLFGTPGLPQTVAFLQIEGRRLQEIVGTWFGVLFWGIGSFSLFASAMGIADYTSRLAADILKSTYLRSSTVSESRLYFWLVWGLVALGCSILLIGMDQPLVLLVISASVGGTMMCLYSVLLLSSTGGACPRPSVSARTGPRR